MRIWIKNWKKIETSLLIFSINQKSATVAPRFLHALNVAYPRFLHEWTLSLERRIAERPCCCWKFFKLIYIYNNHKKIKKNISASFRNVAIWFFTSVFIQSHFRRAMQKILHAWNDSINIPFSCVCSASLTRAVVTSTTWIFSQLFGGLQGQRFTISNHYLSS